MQSNGPIVIDEVHVPQNSNEFYRRHFFPPQFLAQSPRTKDDSDEDIYPDESYVITHSDDDEDFSDNPESYQPYYQDSTENKNFTTNFDLNTTKKLMPPIFHPENLIEETINVNDAQISQAKEDLEKESQAWAKAVECEQEKYRIKIKKLLEKHSKELKAFDTRNGISNMVKTTPKVVKVIPDSYTSSPTFKVRAIATASRMQTVHHSPPRADVKRLRKQLTDRHKREILLLNNEREEALRKLDEKYKSDMSVKSNCIEINRKQHFLVGDVKKPPKPIIVSPRSARLVKINVK
ncbi:hypothetical protein GPJ56_001625 [Histomonas meleagridis]|uniref:uncharacterized protein n=1 Tax=Histomonas meleagridis TaxID=135588 RepID=UPI00355A356F|nr:hypothetical protein GPJ56_001625 [Histomonas meleagridis]KAH0807131.1 hypothetical protein GO595_000307 [Histomonas meleagridis]